MGTNRWGHGRPAGVLIGAGLGTVEAGAGEVMPDTRQTRYSSSSLPPATAECQPDAAIPPNQLGPTSRNRPGRATWRRIARRCERTCAKPAGRSRDAHVADTDISHCHRATICIRNYFHTRQWNGDRRSGRWVAPGRASSARPWFRPRHRSARHPALLTSPGGLAASSSSRAIYAKVPLGIAAFCSLTAQNVKIWWKTWCGAGETSQGPVLGSTTWSSTRRWSRPRCRALILTATECRCDMVVWTGLTARGGPCSRRTAGMDRTRTRRSAKPSA